MDTDDQYDFGRSLDNGNADGNGVGHGDINPSTLQKKSRGGVDFFNVKSNDKKNRKGKKNKAQEFHAPQIVGNSAVANGLREQISLYAADASPVLIVGETGVGKELVARQLHANSPRLRNPFIAYNAAAVPETLAASEFFGHAKGAYTGAIAERKGLFEAANGGSLFLDEIGDLPAGVQGNLLRVLDDGYVTRLGATATNATDVRLITATNVDLCAGEKAEKFRRDLFYRINVLTIHVPPLRERGDDLIDIAQSFIASHSNPDYRKATFTSGALSKLKEHRFPGNVRELRNVIARALALSRGGKISADCISFDQNAPIRRRLDNYDVDHAKTVSSQYMMLRALIDADGNVTKAAELTGRSRGTIHTFLKDLNGKDIAEAYKSAFAEISQLFD